MQVVAMTWEVFFHFSTVVPSLRVEVEAKYVLDALFFALGEARSLYPEAHLTAEHISIIQVIS